MAFKFSLGKEKMFVGLILLWVSQSVCYWIGLVVDLLFLIGTFFFFLKLSWSNNFSIIINFLGDVLQLDTGI